ncbi:hypothetical protein Tco_0801656, partial [Tanacetum coccineum]
MPLKHIGKFDAADLFVAAVYGCGAEPYTIGNLPQIGPLRIPAGFPFFTLNLKQNETDTRFYYPNETEPDPIGNSPVIIRKDLLEKIAPIWMNVSLRMKDDPETDITFGWIVLNAYLWSTRNDSSSLAVNPSCIRSWLDLMSTTPRMAPFLSKKSAFIMALKKELADHVVGQ